MFIKKESPDVFPFLPATSEYRQNSVSLKNGTTDAVVQLLGVVGVRD